MKLSVVPPDLAAVMIPFVSRYANSQNPVRASDFFVPITNSTVALRKYPAGYSHQASAARRFRPAGSTNVPAVSISMSRAGLTPAQKDRFLRINPSKSR